MEESQGQSSDNGHNEIAGATVGGWASGFAIVGAIIGSIVVGWWVGPAIVGAIVGAIIYVILGRRQRRLRSR